MRHREVEPGRWLEATAAAEQCAVLSRSLPSSILGGAAHALCRLPSAAALLLILEHRGLQRRSVHGQDVVG